MPQILHDVWKYVQKEFFVVGHSLEHVENMVQKWECVEVLEGFCGGKVPEKVSQSLSLLFSEQELVDMSSG